MKKNIIALVIILVISLGFGGYAIYANSKKEEAKEYETAYEDGYFAMILTNDEISNDISHLSFKVGDRVDIYLTSTYIKDESLNEPLIKNAKVIELRNKEYKKVREYGNDVKWITINVPEELSPVSQLLSISVSFPYEEIVLKTSTSSSSKVEVNQKLKEILVDTYMVPVKVEE